MRADSRCRCQKAFFVRRAKRPIPRAGSDARTAGSTRTGRSSNSNPDGSWRRRSASSSSGRERRPRARPRSRGAIVRPAGAGRIRSSGNAADNSSPSSKGLPSNNVRPNSSARPSRRKARDSQQVSRPHDGGDAVAAVAERLRSLPRQGNRSSSSSSSSSSVLRGLPGRNPTVRDHPSHPGKAASANAAGSGAVAGVVVAVRVGVRVGAVVEPQPKARRAPATPPAPPPDGSPAGTAPSTQRILRSARSIHPHCRA